VLPQPVGRAVLRPALGRVLPCARSSGWACSLSLLYPIKDARSHMGSRVAGVFFLNSHLKPNAAGFEVLVPLQRSVMRPLYTIQELAQTLRLQPGTVRNKLSRGEDLPRSVRVGRRRLFPEDAVEAWLQAQEALQAIPPPANPTTADGPNPAGRPRTPSTPPVPVRGSRCRKTRSSKNRSHSPAQIALFGKEYG